MLCFQVTELGVDDLNLCKLVSELIPTLIVTVLVVVARIGTLNPAIGSVILG